MFNSIIKKNIMKKLLFILLVTSVFLSCKKDHETPKENELTSIEATFCVIQIENSLPMTLMITDSLNYSISGINNQCRKMHDINQLDIYYHLIDLSENNTHIASFKIQQNNGVKSIYVDWINPIGYISSQTITDSHCGSSNDNYEFSIAVSKI